MFTKKEQEQIAQRYRNGDVDGVIDEVWQRTDKQLRKGVMDGYGKTGYDVNDFDTVMQLNSNVGVFSAFKSYRMHNELKTNLTDENGKKLPFDKFLTNYRKVDKEYNVNYLRSEYNMAQRQAQAANKWSDFEKSKDLYPNLKYMPSRSAEPRQNHKQYYGKVKPINDPVWDTLMPPLAWGCNCWVQATDEPSESTSIEAPLPIDGVVGNPGKQKKVFSNKHPFVKGLPKEQKENVGKFLSQMKDKHLSEQFVSSKVGKGKLKVSLNAAQESFGQNLDLAFNTTSNHGKTFELKGSNKDAPLNYNKTDGDLSIFDKNKNSFEKYNKGKSLSKLKQSFLGLDFSGKITRGNVNSIAGDQINGFKANDGCLFVIAKNNSKTSILNKGTALEQAVKQLQNDLL